MDKPGTTPQAVGDCELATPRMLTWARNSAAYRLSRRMMSERELADAIRRKACHKFEEISQAQLEAVVQAALAFGRQVKALDDRQYAEIRAQSGARSGRSKRKIARNLADKGIERDIVMSVLEPAEDLRPAVVFARKRAFGPFRRKEVDEKQTQRELAAFVRQGFAYVLARRIVEMPMEEAQSVLDLPG